MYGAHRSLPVLTHSFPTRRSSDLLHFYHSVRGLKLGAPVDFRGLELGKVVDIDLELNQTTKRFYALVKAELYPLRFGAVHERLMKNDGMAGRPGAAV